MAYIPGAACRDDTRLPRTIEQENRMMKSLLRRIEALEKSPRHSVANTLELRERCAEEIQKRTGQDYADCWLQTVRELNLPFTIAEIDEVVRSARELEGPRAPA
jgi:predicted transcriptional regulator